MAKLWNDAWTDGVDLDDETLKKLQSLGLGVDNGVENAPQHMSGVGPSLRRMATPQGGGEEPIDPSAFATEPIAQPQRPLTDMVSPDIIASLTGGTVTDPSDRFGQPTPMEAKTGYEMGQPSGVGEADFGPTSLGTGRPKDRTRMDVLEEQYRDAANMHTRVDKAKKINPFSRFFRAAGSNLLNGGDWYTATVQGTNEAINPEARAERVKTDGLKKIWNDIGQEASIEQLDQQRAAAAAKLRRDQTDATVGFNKPALEGMQADDYFSEEESNDYFNRTGILIPPYDKREYDTSWVNGKPYRQPKKGGGAAMRDASLPNDSGKTRKEVTINTPNGPVKLNLTEAETAQALIGAETRAERQRERTEAKIERDNDRSEDRATKIRDEKRKYGAQKAAASSALAKAEASRAELVAQQFDTTQIDSLIAKLSGDVSEADSVLADLAAEEKEMRKATKTVQRSQGSSGRVIAPKSDKEAKQTLAAIEASDATPEQKEAAKQRLYDRFPKLKR